MGKVNGGLDRRKNGKLRKSIRCAPIGRWCNKVKDRGLLASKLGTSKKKGRAKKKG